jgi:hypothetical protein
VTWFGKIAAFFYGRHTLFAVFFAVSGLGLAIVGKLTREYVALCIALQACIGVHSWKEDVFDGKAGDDRAADRPPAAG